MSATYMLAMNDFFVAEDDLSDVLLLRDTPMEDDAEYLAALVASGDYFVTVAVTLEEVASVLPGGSVAQYQLQDLIGQLLRLQRHYKISKK